MADPTMEEMNSLSRLGQIEFLQNLLIARATGGGQHSDDSTYRAIREILKSDESLFQRLPEAVRTNRSIGQFWGFIKYEFSSYADRRNFLWNEFKPIIEFLEEAGGNPAISSIEGAFEQFDAEAVHRAWNRALSRRENDPEGAITAARTLLETVCKHILDECNVKYRDSEELPQLWHLTAQQLNLAPEQHQEETFKTILGSCSQIASRLANMRNTVGDAHGTGRLQVKPKPRHAELAVNLAGTMSAFLVSTWQETVESRESS